MRGRGRWLWVVWGAMWGVLSCAPTSSPDRDRAAVCALIAAENEAARSRDADRLASLWAEDGVVRDANHTPGDLSDDRVWKGRDAVMSRYTSVLFWLVLDNAGPVDLEVDVQGDAAVVTATTRMGEELSPGGERWMFVRRAGEWQIAGITYNLEANGR